MSEHQHALHSPSSAHRWFACPGSIRESAGMPNIESAAAREGTFLHEVATICLRKNCDAMSMLGHTDMVHVLDEAQAAAVQEAIDYVRALKGERHWLDLKVRATEEVYGTLDVAVMTRNPANGLAVVHVIDFKFGSGVFVPVENNEQLLSYGTGFLLSDRWAEVDEPFDEIVFHIVQPRHHRKDELQPWGLSPFALQDWYTRTLPAHVAATKNPNAPLIAGDHCQFCPARPSCRELRRVAKEQVTELFQDETLTVPATKPPEPSRLSPEEVAVALKAFPTIEAWIEAVRSFAYAQAIAGHTVPGWKLVEKHSNRQWISEANAALTLEAYMPNGVVPFTTPKLVTPSEAERRLPKELRGVVDKLVTRVVTGVSLVPESDPRPAAMLPGADVFDDGTLPF